ncbi:flavin reductase [Pseudarthrobacter sp. J75]|uniref:flavin reductase n=1 Tax=unclassified Pseudarthrobacter TaxID=2647000 RepID=UPI002E7FB850|nr:MULTISPECIES: flavin reductase [unclassified Pseudarthrobacter]MEE2522448.1 flavin reductase [Pseudarthrobacter sp. J47]MEE2529221.1 flavin reductase [Pseudarthrobacter sp. J75]
MSSSQTSGNVEQVLADQAVFRSVVGHFASGVTVISTQVDGKTGGSTASAVSSLSMDPPMMLMCLNQSSHTHDMVQAAGGFAVNILAEGQEAVAMQFARKGEDKFEGVAHHDSLGMPVVDGALATIVCRTVETVRGGTHTVFLAEVLGATEHPGLPLTYFRGKFGRLDRSDENGTYEKVRSWVLSRSAPVGTAVDMQELAEELGGQQEHVRNALIRLGAERLVTRVGDGAYAVALLPVETIQRLLEVRTGLAMGIIEAHSSKIVPAHIAAMRAHLGTLDSLRIDGALVEYLVECDAFYADVAKIAGSLPLSNANYRYSISQVWGTATITGWADLCGHSYLRDIVDALELGDAASATDAVAAHGRALGGLAGRITKGVGL